MYLPLLSVYISYDFVTWLFIKSKKNQTFCCNDKYTSQKKSLFVWSYFMYFTSSLILNFLYFVIIYFPSFILVHNVLDYKDSYYLFISHIVPKTLLNEMNNDNMNSLSCWRSRPSLDIIISALCLCGVGGGEA